MRSRAPWMGAARWLMSLLALSPACCLAAATLTQQIDPPEVNVGDPAIVTLTVQGGSIGAIKFPHVDGLEAGGTSFQIKSSDENGNSTTSVSLNVSLIPIHPGKFVIPAFDLHTEEGEVLHVKEMKLHAIESGNSQVAPSIPLPVPATNPDSSVNVSGGGVAEIDKQGAKSIPAAQAPAQLQQALGPVVMPATNAPPAPAQPPTNVNPDANGWNVSPPRDADGSLAKVFILITPQTTQAYVGEAIPLEIDFFIRMDVASDQNSLPTIKGSDFLMNSFNTRGQGRLCVLENEQYGRETWQTAISAPKSGDFPLSMVRDTYWIKSISTTNVNSFFGGMFGRQANLAHEPISSNLLTIHVEPLPAEGRPTHFSGAIGHFKVTGEAAPDSVEVGEPVTLRYTVSGDGNFDYVRCPTLANTDEWKAYAPRSGTNFLNESRTMAVKTFEQSVIPRKNGNVPLPAASFSYFDPTAKQYVTIPIALPDIVVTGTPPPLAAAAPEVGADSVAATGAPKTTDFQPNRVEIGSLQMSLVPIYRQPWFWAVETALVSLPLIGVVLLFFRMRFAPDAGLTEREQRLKSVRQEEDSMAEAVRRQDARAFFIAARHAVQLQLGSQWSEHPEALTLGEIRRRDPQLAERLAPLFQQVDEVIYSGRASAGLDLAQWEQRVRTELLQPQPA